MQSLLDTILALINVRINRKEGSMVPDKLIPLVYLFSVALIAAGLHYLKVDVAMIGLIVGAGLMRVKIPAPGNEQVKSDQT